jgi:hypothetical protein
MWIINDMILRGILTWCIPSLAPAFILLMVHIGSAS